MFDKILSNNNLCCIIRHCCEENGISVEFHDALLLANGDLNHDKVVILKIDSYYDSHNMHNPPPSVDYLIIIKCDDGGYNFYLVELRNVTGTPLIKPREISGKFHTTIYDFLSERFSDIFTDPSFVLKKLKLWLVTNPFNTGHLTLEQYEKKVKGTVIEQYNALKPFRFRDKVAMIEVKSPTLENQVQTIFPC